MFKFAILGVLILLSLFVIDWVINEINIQEQRITVIDKSDDGKYQIKIMSGEWVDTSKELYDTLLKGNTYIVKIEKYNYPNRKILDVV